MCEFKKTVYSLLCPSKEMKFNLVVVTMLNQATTNNVVEFEEARSSSDSPNNKNVELHHFYG